MFRGMAHNVSAKPDARRQARVPKAKARSAAAGFACYVLCSVVRRIGETLPTDAADTPLPTPTKPRSEREPDNIGQENEDNYKNQENNEPQALLKSAQSRGRFALGLNGILLIPEYLLIRLEQLRL
jgi:hypothetical protein